MKKIRKNYSGVVPNGKVLNSKNASLQNTYSCDYLNRTIPNTKDLGEIIVDDIHCKNIFNKNSVISGYALLNATGELSKLDGWCTSEYIPVKAGENITISGKDSAGSGNCFYDENKNFITTITAISGTITVPDGACYLRVNLKIEDKNTCQIEKGSVATNYVPHKEYDNDIVAATLQANINALASKLNVITKNTGNGYTVTFNGTLTGRYIFVYMAILNGGYGVAGTFALLNGNIVNSSKFLDNAEAGTVTITPSTTGFTLKFARNYTTCTIISPNIALT